MGNSSLPFPNAPGGGYPSLFSSQAQQQPPAPPPNFYDYLNQSFPNTDPHDLPDNAYQAMQEKFFQDHVVPWAMQEGHPIAPLQEGFMQQTARPNKAEYPRMNLVGKSALAGLASPLRALGSPEAADYADQAETEAAKEAARQGINPGLYQFMGQTLGQAPYWAAGMALAGPLIAGAAPELAAGTGLSEAALTKLMHVTAGALIQGSYDAAKAPEGSRLAEGFRGAALGGGMVAGIELLKGLPYFLHSKGVPMEQAEAVGKVATGVATPEEEGLAAQAAATNPKIDEHIKNYVQTQQAGTKAAGVPKIIDTDVAPTLLNLDVTGADGKSYTLGPYNEQSWRPGLSRLVDHLQNGGSLDAVRADQATAQRFLKALEEHIGDTTNTLDLDVPEWGAASTPDSFTEQRPNDTTRGSFGAYAAEDTALAEQLRQEEAEAGEVRRFASGVEQAEQARIPRMRGPGYGKPISFGENVAPLEGGGRIVFRARRLGDSPRSWIAPNGQINYFPTDTDPDEWLSTNFPRAVALGQGVRGTAGVPTDATPSYKAMAKGWIRVDGPNIEGSLDVQDSPNLATAMQLAARYSTSTDPTINVRLGDVTGSVRKSQMADFLSSPITFLREGGFEARGPMFARRLDDIIGARDSLYHSTTPEELAQATKVASIYKLPVRAYETAKELAQYRAGMSRLDPMFARRLPGEEMPWQDLGREGSPLPIPPLERPADLHMPDYKTLETVKNLYDSGMGLNDIAERMGLDYRTVLGWLEGNVKEHIPLETLGRNITERELKGLREAEPIETTPFDTMAARRLKGSQPENAIVSQGKVTPVYTTKWESHADWAMAYPDFAEEAVRVSGASVEFNPGKTDMGNVSKGLRIAAANAKSSGVSSVVVDAGGRVSSIEVKDLEDHAYDFTSVPKLPYADPMASKGRVRGSADVPMNDNGRDDVNLNARILANQYDSIYSGDLNRTRETADILSHNNPRARVNFPDERFNSWARGQFEGGDPDVARQFSDAIVSDPDQWDTPQPGISPYSGKPGESFNQFHSRVAGGFEDVFNEMDANPDKLIAVATHYNPLRLIESQLRAGASPRDMAVDFEHFLGREPEPGAIYHVDPDYTFSKFDPITWDGSPRQGVDIWRHGETDWNPRPPTYVERPLGWRKIADLGLSEEAPDALTHYTEPGEKPSIEYNRDILDEMKRQQGSSIGARGLITHESVHAHANNLGIHPWFLDNADGFTNAVYDGMLRKIDYGPREGPEEVFAYTMQAIRAQDSDILAKVAKADTDPETVLDWFTNKGLDLQDYLAAFPKSLHRDTFMRRLSYTIGQASRSLEDVRRPFTQTHDVGFDPDEDMWYTEDLQNGIRHHFLTKEGALSYLEQYQEPLNTPDLLPQDRFPKGFAFAARRIPGPSTSRAPLTTDPLPPTLQDAEMRKLMTTGVAAMSNIIRPFYDWVGTVANRLSLPALAQKFFAIDDAQVEFSNAMRPTEELLEKTLRTIDDGRLPDTMPYLRAETQAGRDAASAQFRYTPEELTALERFRMEYPHDDFWQYIQKDVPQMRQNNWDIATRYPRGLDTSMVGDLVRRGRLDPREENPLKVAAEFARGQSFHDILKPVLDDAQDFLSEDRKGENALGMLHPLLQRQLSYLRGNPDWTQQVVMGAVGKAAQLINKVIDGANTLLPESLQLGRLEEAPRDILQQFILFNYAGALALRPAIPIRDALQIMLTTYPILGEKYLWSGMRRAFSGGEDSLGRDAYEAGLRNGWMIERSNLPEMVAGGSTEGGGGIEGAVEHWTKKALSVISWAHNTNRLVAGWGHTLKMMDALEDFARTGDQDAFIRQSDLWFLNSSRRDMLVREAAQIANHPTQWEPFAQRAARNLVDATQWNYRRGANPGLYKFQLGRLFGQYGTWPMNYIEYARKFYDAATGPYRAEALKAMFRLGAAHGGVLSAAGAVGIDASHWVFTQPMAYGGGPMFQAVTSIPGSMDFQTYKGTEARRNLIEPIWPGMIPGAEEAHGLWQAITEGDKGQWQRVLGFSPMGKGEEERGWHRFVP